MKRAVAVTLLLMGAAVWVPGIAQATCVAPPTVADPAYLSEADAAFVGTVIEHRDEEPSFIPERHREQYDTVLFSVEYDVHGNLGETVEAVAGAPGWGDIESGPNFDYEEGTRIGTVLYLENGYWFAAGGCPLPADPDAFMAAAENVVPASHPVIGPPGPPLPESRRAEARGPLALVVGALLALGAGVAITLRIRRSRAIRSEGDASSHRPSEPEPAYVVPRRTWRIIGWLAGGLACLSTIELTQWFARLGDRWTGVRCDYDSADASCQAMPYVPFILAALVVGIIVMILCTRLARLDRTEERSHQDKGMAKVAVLAVGLAFMVAVLAVAYDSSRNAGGAEQPTFNIPDCAFKVCE